MRLEEKLVLLRKQKGLSQIYVAEAMEVSRQAISRWEVGAAMPSTDNLRKLAELYGVSIDVLLNEAVNLEDTRKECQTSEDVQLPNENTSSVIQIKFPMKPILYLSIAVVLSLMIFQIGYFLGRTDAEQKQDEPIPLSELETMDWDFSDAAIGTYGWPDFGEGGEEK